MDVELRTTTLLLVEDNPSDAERVAQMLDDPARESFGIIRAERIADAIRTLRTAHVDVVLLDLQLPDSSGTNTVKAVRAIAGDAPIVVLTGMDDEHLALRCIDAGAQDYLPKRELQPQSLRRVIGYAITRQREAQIRELRHMLDRMRQLSTDSTRTPTTATLASNGPVRERHRSEFAQIVAGYGALLTPYLDHLIVRTDKPRAQMEIVITRLGDLGAGPRDLMDVHIAALDASVDENDTERSRALTIEGRLLALEMMGLLVDYYRTGQRRRFL